MYDHDMKHRVSKIQVLKDRIHYLQDDKLDELLRQIPEPEREDLREDIARISKNIR